MTDLFSSALHGLKTPVFKIAVAVAVIGLLFYFNRIDLSLLTSLLDTWPWLLAAFFCTLPPFFVVSFRFQLVLNQMGVKASYKEAFRWTMIGSFFDLALPSSNGGDVVKAGYVLRKVQSGTRTQALMAVIFDRTLGIIGLFLLASMAGLVGWSYLAGLPSRGYVIASAFILGIGPILAFWILGSRWLYERLVNNNRLCSSTWGRRFLQLISAFRSMRERPATLVIALVLSMLNHSFWCVSLLCISYAVGNSIYLALGFTIFPIAIFGGVFGVAGGFGVGTAAFDLVYSKLLMVNNGALVGLIFHLIGAISRFLGLPFYLYSNRNH